MTSLHTTKWFLNISRTNLDCKTRLDYDDFCTIGSDTTGLLQLRATGQGTGNNCSMISYRTALDNSLRWIDAIHFFLPGIWSGIIWGNMTWYLCMHLYHIHIYILDAYKSFTKRDWEKKCVLHIISRLYNGSFNQHMEFEGGASHTSLPKSPFRIARFCVSSSIWFVFL